VVIPTAFIVSPTASPRPSVVRQPHKLRRAFGVYGSAYDTEGLRMENRDAQEQDHLHDWVKSESLLNAGGVPYDVEQVRCSECGEVLEQDKKRIVA
jgi:hypothetical protein